MAQQQTRDVVIELSNTRSVTISKPASGGPYYVMLAADDDVVTLSVNEMIMLVKVGKLVANMDADRIAEAAAQMLDK